MSIDVRLPSLLRQLRLPTVVANYRKFAQEAAHTRQPYEEYLLALLEHEVDQRDVNRRKRRVLEARFPVVRTLDEFDFQAIPGLSQTKVLALARGEYLERRENIAMIGAIGTGKTHIAIALGLAACEQGHRVRFYTAAGLINDLLEAQEAHRLSKLEAWLSKQDLIIVDEVGFVPFSQRGAQMLFTFISQRYLRGSLIVTSNLAFAEWTEVFGDPRLTSALLDRLTHRCHILEFAAESYRFRQSLQRQAGLSSADTPHTADGMPEPASLQAV
jgi:DNA replication protein DnaC